MGDLWEELRTRQAQLVARLQAAPRVTIEGTADSTGVTAVKFQGEEHWTLKLTLEAWRLVGGTVQDSPLSLRQQVTAEDLEFCKRTLQPFGQFRIQVRLLMGDGGTGPEALLEAIPLAIDDHDLRERTRQLQLPVTYQDELFGTCLFDKQTKWFDAKANWNETEVRVYLSAESTDALPSVLEHAYELWRNAVSWSSRVSDRAVDDLLELKNKTWLESCEHAVSADEFKQRLSLQSVSIDKDAAFEFCFADGDLF